MAMVPAMVDAVRLRQLLGVLGAAAVQRGAGHELAAEEVPVGLRVSRAGMPGGIATHLATRETVCI